MTNMTTEQVRCLHVEARLAEPALELRRARAAASRGDAAWRQRLEGFARGDTVIVDLTATAVIHDGGAGKRPAPPCHYCHEVVWVQRSTASRALADRLRELARRRFTTTGSALRDRGIQLGTGGAELTVELSIDPAVTARLGTPPGFS
jgi:hypothetical protein